MSADREGYLLPAGEEFPLMTRIVLAANSQHFPPEIDDRGSTKTAKLARIGWRILPVPQLIRAGEMGRTENGKPCHPDFLDFIHADCYVVIPPEETGLRAEKIAGRNKAVAWAWKTANAHAAP